VRFSWSGIRSSKRGGLLRFFFSIVKVIYIYLVNFDTLF